MTFSCICCYLCASNDIYEPKKKNETNTPTAIFHGLCHGRLFAE